MHVAISLQQPLSLGTLVPNTRDWHEKNGNQTFALQNTP